MIKKITLSLLFAPTAIFAQGYQANFQGQAQQAMGSAGSSLMQDANSLFYNPGGCSFVKDKSSISVGVTAVIANVGFQEANSGKVYRSNSPVTPPFTAFGLFRKKYDSRLSFGLGIYTPFGSTISYEDKWAGRYALQSLALRAIFVQPTLSYKITEKLGFGIGFVYATGSVNLKRDIPLTNNTGESGKVELDGKAQGYGFNAGIYIKGNDKLSFGLTYRTQVDMAIKSGDATFTVPSALSPNFPSGKFTSSLPLPQVVTFGSAYSPNEKLSLVADINFIGWAAYDTLTFDYEVNTPSLADTKAKRGYKNSFALRIGAQYKATEKLVLRAGLAFGQTPVPKDYMTPETPDANRINYSIGAGFRASKHFALDASLFATYVQRSGTNLETNLTGEIKVIAFAPGISFTYIF